MLCLAVCCAYTQIYIYIHTYIYIYVYLQENGSLLSASGRCQNVDELAKDQAAQIAMLLTKYKDVLQFDRFLNTFEQQAHSVMHTHACICRGH